MRILTALTLALALALLAGGAALAQPRQGHGDGPGRGSDHGQGQGQDKDKDKGKGQGRGQGQGRGGHPSQIADDDRGAIYAYFGQQFALGNCPPGLAKKNNGCLPPGQARKWAVGQRLPAGLGYALPPDLLRRLAPPVGYTYMRVGTDILMIAVGTSLVVYGLQDLLR